MTDHTARKAGLTTETLYQAVLDCLMNHGMQHTEDTGSGEKYPLVDKLCAPGDDSIKTGKEEVEILVEDIVDAIGPMVLAAHSADARNGEGAAPLYAMQAIKQLCREIKQSLDIIDKRQGGACGATESIHDKADAIVAVLLAAPAAPAPKPADSKPLTRFVEYMNEHCIGLTVTEDALVEWLADVLDSTPREVTVQHGPRRLEASAPAPAVQACNCGAGDCDGSCAPHIGQQPAPAAQADSDLPLGAIENGRAYADRLEAYPFESEGGTLRLCSDWQEFRRCFEYMAQYLLSRQQSAAPAECTCPSGNGSLRHPCPVHSGEPVAWLRDDGDDVITSAKKTSLELTNGLPGARVAGTYNTPLYRATPADAASEADKREGERG